MDHRIAADRTKIRPALTLMYEHYADPLRVPDLAKACSLSRSSFYHYFRRLFKKEPKAFLNELRLDQAMRLLNTTERKISDIALGMGFFNLSFFNRFFKAKMGVSPRGFRKLNLNRGHS